MKYEQNIHRSYFDTRYKDFVSTFVLMVKSGEIYNYDGEAELKDGFL
jgi:hypothetical protein